MLQLVIAERLFTVLLPGESGMAWLYFPFVCWSRDWKRSGHPGDPFPMIPGQGQSGYRSQKADAAQVWRVLCHSPVHQQLTTSLLAWSPPSLPALPHQSTGANTVCMWNGLNPEYFILFMESVTILSYARHEAQGCREITRRKHKLCLALAASP